MTEITIHSDGASRGNPGAAAIAYVIEGLPDGKIEFAKTIGITTNNKAEYLALKGALENLAQYSVANTKVTCVADSELMVKQVRGEYRVKDVNLKPHFEAIREMVALLQESGNVVEFLAVRRANNKRADELGNMALDGLL
jgi:ribonuclease HI